MTYRACKCNQVWCVLCNPPRKDTPPGKACPRCGGTSEHLASCPTLFRDRRVALGKIIYDIAKATGLQSATVSGVETGRIQDLFCESIINRQLLAWETVVTTETDTNPVVSPESPSEVTQKAGEADFLTDEQKRRVHEALGTKAGECEHEWQFGALLGPGLTASGKEEKGFMCECGETRTVADFWKETVPEHPNPKARCWYVPPSKEYLEITTIEYARLGRLDKGTLYFHHPDYIIEPPPVPE